MSTIQTIIVPLLGIAAVAYYVLVIRKKQVGAMDKQTAGFRAGELAQRLGLQVVQGDPMFNLFIPQANVDAMRGPKDGKPVHIEILLKGEAQGVPLELYYLSRVEKKTDHIKGIITWTTWFECRMTAEAKKAFPEFEVTSRGTPMGPITRSLTLAEARTGNPAVDAAYMVATSEPALAQVLGSQMGAFSEFGTAGVHLVGDGKSVSFHMLQAKPPMIAYGLYYPEAMAKGLAAIARAVGG
jgi:hypothetical protein